MVLVRTGRTLIVLMACMMITSGLLGCLDETDDEEPMVPLTLGVTSISTDESSGTLDLEIKLYDRNDKVMMHDGEFRLIIKDPDYSELLNRTFMVNAKDFEKSRTGIVTTYYYTISIPYYDLAYFTDAMKEDPNVNLRFFVWFTYDEVTIKEFEIWPPPDDVRIEDVEVDEDNETVRIGMYCYDRDDFNTKGPGTLRLTIWDSDDMEMYSGTYKVRDQDFWFRFYNDTYYVSYEVDIPFAEFQTSHDRMVDKPGPPGELEIGRLMRIGCEFSFGNTNIVVGPNHVATYNTRIEIPEALLYPNEFPTAVLEGPKYVVLNKYTTFSSRKSTDDL